MKIIVIVLSVLIQLFSNSCKEKSPYEITSTQNANATEQSQVSSSKLPTEDLTFNFQQWNYADQSKGTYKGLHHTIQLKSYLDEKNNIGGKKIYLNNTELDFIVSDAYAFTPYFFINNEQSVILVKEEDEGGIYGYILYYLKNDKLILKEYLEIAPLTEVDIQQFVKLEKARQALIVSVLSDSFYNTKLDKIEISNNKRFVFSLTNNVKDVLKNETVESDVGSAFTSNIKKSWAVNCQNELTELQIDKDAGFLSLYSLNAIYINLKVEKSATEGEYILKFSDVSSQREFYKDKLLIRDDEISKDKPIGRLAVDKDGNAVLHWTGLYNLKKNKLEFVGNDFLLIKENAGRTPVILQKCE